MTIAVLGASTARALLTAADDASADERRIPVLGPDVLAAWWPGIGQRLPRGFAFANGGVVDGDDDGAQIDGSAWAGVMWHPTAEWSFGGGIGYQQRRFGLGEEFPDEARHVRVPLGAWRRLSLDDHLVFLAVPGLNFSDDEDARTEFTAPVFAGWFHRASRSVVWGVGVGGIIGERRPLVLPVAGAFLTPGPWNIVLTPVYVGADRLLSPQTSLGAFAGFSGDATPVRYDGEDRDAVYWDLRLGLRGTWKTAIGATAVIDGGWAVVRCATISDGLTGDALVERRLDPSPFLGASLTWSW